MPRPGLTEVELPSFAQPTIEPSIPAETYAGRLTQLMSRLADAKLDAVVIYGDREHAANIAWLTGYDPRFEEAICIAMPGRDPHLLVGNEGWAYASLAKGRFKPVLWQPLSLMAQPRDRTLPLADLLKDAGLKSGMRIGVAGWKGAQRADGSSDPDVFELPHYIVENLRALGSLANVADMFMSPANGLRTINDIDQLASFEFAATHTSQAVRNVLTQIRPGMTEFEVVQLMRIMGLPWSVHLMMSSGPRARVGLSSPSMRRIARGDPVTVAYGVHGGLNCRAGWLVESQGELPAEARDYVDRLMVPYFAAAAAWYETIGIGVPGGDVFAAAMRHVGDPFFGISLNPGHLIHLDEWLHSPISRNSNTPLRSGMALQCDIIPATGTAYFTSNIEDGICLADKDLRAAFESKYPEAWERIQKRRIFMQDALGIKLKPEVLPFSNIAGWLPPFWLNPKLAMTCR